MNAWRRWTAFVDRREDGSTLALFRIAVAAVTLGTLLSTLPHGQLDAMWVDRRFGGYRDLGEGSWLVALLGGPTPGVVHGLAFATALASLALLVGFGGRLVAFAALQGYLALQTLNAHATGSSDGLVRNALWLLVLARADTTLSLACLRRTGRWTSGDTVLAFPRELAIVQLVVVYFASGIQKLSTYWFPTGDWAALWYVLQQPTWQRMDMTWAAPLFPLTQAATAATWIFEVGAPILLLHRWARATAARSGLVRRLLGDRRALAAWAAFGVSLHLGIVASLAIGHFSAIALAFYVCLLEPYEVRRALARAGGHGGPRHAGAFFRWWTGEPAP